MNERTHRRGVAVLAVLVALLAVGCSVFFTVEKQVTNSSSTGPFIVHFNCVNNAPFSPQTGDITFNGAGTSAPTEFGTSPSGPTTCTITEPTSAAAETVTIECVTPPGGVSCSSPSNTLTVTLPATTSDISVSLRVTNDFTPTSAPTTTSTVAGVAPDAPTNVTATIGSVIVSWTPPSNVGTSAITGYVITQSPGGATYSASAGATTLTIECPARGTYTYVVQAVNASGSSVPSAPSNAVTVTEVCNAVSAQPNVTG